MSSVKSPIKRESKKRAPKVLENDVETTVMHNDSNEARIRHFGYEPEKRITLRRTNGDSKVYYFARSPMGFHVYIEVDSTDVKTGSSKEELLEESSKGLTIPYSFKQGIFEDVGESAIVCSEGLCRIGRKVNSTEMGETNYVFNSLYTDSFAQDKKGIIAYPVVRLGEISANPMLVLEHTSKIMARIRRNTYQTVEMAIQNYQRELDLNTVLFQRFVDSQHEIAEGLAKSMKELQIHQEATLHNPPTKETDIAFAEQVNYNLRYRNDKSTHFLELCSQVQKMGGDLHELNVQFENTLRTFRNEFNDVHVFKGK